MDPISLVTVRRGSRVTSLLFDTGLSPDAMVSDAERLGVDLTRIQAVILSRGHFDHAGGIAGLAQVRGTRALPMVLRPQVWTRRLLALGRTAARASRSSGVWTDAGRPRPSPASGGLRTVRVVVI